MIGTYIQMNNTSNETALNILRSSGYIDCKKSKHNISNCKVIQLIIDILQYYHQIQQDSNNPSNMDLYRYISDQQYDITTLMEDWQQCKKNHLRKQENIDSIKNMMKFICSKNACGYSKRHERDRERGMYTRNANIHAKDIIIMDQLDSIHQFIFHSFSHRSRYRKHGTVVVQGIHETDNLSATFDEAQNIWHNVPESINECNLAQIVFIVQHHSFSKLKQNFANKLMTHKNSIIEYMTQHSFDGNKLHKMSRKEFATKFAGHLKDKKLTVPLSRLYKVIMDYDISWLGSDSTDEENSYDIWANNPTSIYDCNLDQIIFIVQNHAFDNLKQQYKDKLMVHKNSIINYMKTNDFNGNKFREISRKQFAVEFKAHLKDKKLSMQLLALYKCIDEYDVTILHSENKDAVSEEENKNETTNNNVKIKKSKFITTMDLEEKDESSKAQYYSFGTAFRYTKNLQEHPFYVVPKYKNIKEDLIYYLQSIYQKEDEFQWRQDKMNTAKSTVHEQVLQHFYHNDDILNVDFLFMDKQEQKSFSSSDNGNQVYEHLTNIIKELCPHFGKSQSSADIARNALEAAFEEIVTTIKQRCELEVKRAGDTLISLLRAIYEIIVEYDVVSLYKNDKKFLDLSNLYVNEQNKILQLYVKEQNKRTNKVIKLSKEIKQPTSIKQCNMDMIMFILENYAFGKLNRKYKENYKEHISNYIKQNQCHGNK
eukprot:52533_1